VSELRRYVAQHRAEFAASVLDSAQGVRGHELGWIPGRQYARACDGLLNSLLHVVQAATPDHPCWTSVSLAGVAATGVAHCRYTATWTSVCSARAIWPKRSPLPRHCSTRCGTRGSRSGTRSSVQTRCSNWPRKTCPRRRLCSTGVRWPARRRPARADAGPCLRGALRYREDPRFSRAARGALGEREERYGDSIYLLEPDVRNGPGGLRDLDVAQWAARARWKIQTLKDLVRIGILVPREWQQIENGRQSHVACAQFSCTSKRAGAWTRLSYDRQEQTASRWATRRTARRRTLHERVLPSRPAFSCRPAEKWSSLARRPASNAQTQQSRASAGDEAHQRV